jgi:N-acetyl-anhydromuramyl-L-alanine amidase AmpD
MTRLNAGKLVFKRNLMLKTPPMLGDDIKQWQQFLGIVDDGSFGPHTLRSTLRMQRELGVMADGVVGAGTIAAANRYESKPDEELTVPDLPSNMDSVPSVASLVSAFKQATKYTKANRTPDTVRNIVIHTAEIGESLSGAEALMNVCASPDQRNASWHFAVDADTITQSVLVKDVAWHAPGCNSVGIGIEMSGRARQSVADWHDDFSTKMLDLCARLCAALCNEWDIPPVLVGEVDLVAGKQGITTHAIVSKAFKKSDHWDPGPNFPVDEFLASIRRYLRTE